MPISNSHTVPSSWLEYKFLRKSDGILILGPFCPNFDFNTNGL